MFNFQDTDRRLSSSPLNQQGSHLISESFLLSGIYKTCLAAFVPFSCTLLTMSYQGYPYHNSYDYSQPSQNHQGFFQTQGFEEHPSYAQEQYPYDVQNTHPAEGIWPNTAPQGYPTHNMQNYPEMYPYANGNGPPTQQPQVQMQVLPNPPPQNVPEYSEELKICAHCGTQTTPEWRREPHSHRLLCNACGLHFNKKGYHRPVDFFSPQPYEISPDPNGRQCSNCGTRSAPTWRRSVDGNTLCNACGMYARTHGTDRPVKFQSSSHFKPRKHREHKS